MHRLATEVATFDRCLPFLLRTAMGKYALVKGENVHGTFALYVEAMDAAHDRFPNEPFLIRLVAPEDEVPFPFLLASVEQACEGSRSEAGRGASGETLAIPSSG